MRRVPDVHSRFSVEAIIAGWALGYAMALLTTVVFAVIAARLQVGGWLDAAGARDVAGPMLAIPVFVGATLGWTLAGAVLGAAYDVLDCASGPEGLGSPCWPFSATIVLLAWIPLPPLFLLWRKGFWLCASMSVSFAALFGWLMPYLAGR